MDTGAATELFQNAMAEKGLNPGQIVPDGAIHRFSVNGHRGLAGWYVFFADGIPSGAWGDWHNGETERWCSKSGSQMSPEELAEQKRKWALAKKLREEEQSKRHAEARDRAQSIWDSSSGADNTHGYLSRKRISPHGTRVDKDGKLLVPICHFTDSGAFDLWGVQEILANGKFFHGGDKNFHSGTKKRGGFFAIGEHGGSGMIYFCEGFATGASINEATGKQVVVCFDAGNLEPVVGQWRAMHPDREFVLCGDDDRWTTDNPGRTKATAAAEKYHCRVVFPEFGSLDSKPTDFNDLAVLEGLEAVKAQLLNDTAGPTLSPDRCRVSDRLKCRPPDRELLFSLPDKTGGFPAETIGVLAASGGTGKSFWILSLCHHATLGIPFGPFVFKRPLRILYFSLEDDQDEIDRRLWDVAGGSKFSPNLFTAAYPGEIGPIMMLSDGNPVRSESFYWIDRELVKYNGQLDLVILDTQSRFSGLSENVNEHGAAFVAALEALKFKHHTAILTAAHTNKEADKNPPPRMAMDMLRGASSIASNVRLVYAMRALTPQKANEFGISETDRIAHVEFDTVKSNYGAKLKHPLFYKRDENGVLRHVNPYKERVHAMAETFVEILNRQDEELNARDLQKTDAGKAVFEEMLESFPGFKKGEDTISVIDYAMKQGWLKKATIPRPGGQQKEVLRVVSAEVKK